ATAIKPCAKEDNAAQCVLLGATCSKDLSFGFFSCRCQFSMVPSPKGCVSILEQELLATKDYQLEVSDVEWSDSLSTITSIESLLLIEKFYKLVVRIDASLCTDDACLPGQSCNLIASEVGFQCTCPFPQTLIEGIHINATAIEPCAKEENTAQCVLLGASCNKDLSFGFFSCICQFPMVPSPKGCVSMLKQELLATKDYQLEISGVECNSVGVEAKVSLTLSNFSVLDSILELIAPGLDVSIKTASLISEKDPSLSRFVEQKVSIQLNNQRISDYDNPTSAKYITLITAINLAINNLQIVLTVLGGQTVLVIPGLQHLQFDLNTLNFELVSPPCDTSKC
ncbi:hypothetical protein QYM36_003727, partial [Artemia franciscana]